MSWLEEHIEMFVKPRACSVDVDTPPLGFFQPEELTVIKNAWRSVKRSANGKTVFLPGRDVFIFEILARRENYPTVFMPECSRQTVHEIAQNTDLKNLFLFDTGFAGSIPRNIGSQKFGLLSHSQRDSTKIQIFPRLTWSRSLALKIELTPKYWESGRVVFQHSQPEIVQPWSHLDEFIQAARLTIEIYKNSSPRFVAKHKPLSNTQERWW